MAARAAAGRRRRRQGRRRRRRKPCIPRGRRSSRARILRRSKLLRGSGSCFPIELENRCVPFGESCVENHWIQRTHV
eukprot:7390409-Prymnesium_polylepis.2